MSQAVFDLCYFDEVVFDYKIYIIIAAARLDIVIRKKSMLVTDLSVKANLEAISGKKVSMDNLIGTKANMLVAGGTKSSLDIELLGGGS